jgi:hypothetical protein
MNHTVAAEESQECCLQIFLPIGEKFCIYKGVSAAPQTMEDKSGGQDV